MPDRLHQAVPRNLEDLRDLGTPLFSTTFAVVDLETTGGSPTADAITEIGAIKSTGGQVSGTFHTLVSPGCPIPGPIQGLCGIGDHAVAGAPPIELVLDPLWEFLRGAVLVAHNARFDAAFLAAAFGRHGYRVPFRGTVDTLRLARRLLAGETCDLRLETLAGYLGASVEPCHRAFPDARATFDVFHQLLEHAGSVGVLTCEDLLVFGRTGRAPDLARMKMAAGVPRAPGVYLFVDAHGRVLHIGRARNLRARVRSHFYGDNRRGMADLLRRAVAVRAVRCATELEAEVRELRLVRLHRPPSCDLGHAGGRSPGPAWAPLARDRVPRPAWICKVPGKVARLAVTRSPAHAASALLGPFPSQRAAREVVEAIQNALPLPRCSDPRRHPSGCTLGRTGRCVAPCLPERRPAHDSLLSWLKESLAGGGADLLAELDARMATRAEVRGYMGDPAPKATGLSSHPIAPCAGSEPSLSGAGPGAPSDLVPREAAEGETNAVFQQSVRLAYALECRRAARTLAAAGDLVVCVPRRSARSRDAGEATSADSKETDREVDVAAIRCGRLVGAWTQPATKPVDVTRAFEVPALQPAALASGGQDWSRTHHASAVSDPAEYGSRSKEPTAGASSPVQTERGWTGMDLGDLEECMILWRFLGRAARRGGWVATCTGELSSRITDRLAAERVAAGPAGRPTASRA